MDLSDVSEGKRNKKECGIFIGCYGLFVEINACNLIYLPNIIGFRLERSIGNYCELTIVWGKICHSLSLGDACSAN